MLQWGRELSPAEIPEARQIQSDDFRFNGAASFRPRRLAEHSEAMEGAFGASMGPRAFARGDLQSQSTRQPNRGASMGPRAFARGDAAAKHVAVEEKVASMGPRAFARGDANAAPASKFSGRLQWGRELSPAEIRRRTHRPQQRSPLQWGRELSPAEMRLHRPSPQHRLHQLQWGRELSPAEIRADSRPRETILIASMGPRAFARGDVCL